LKQERTAHTNRIKGLLASVGVRLKVGKTFLQQLDEAKQWNGERLPASLRERLRREGERLALLGSQIAEVERFRRKAQGEATEKVQRLQELRGIGENSSWLFVLEFFGWRQFRNRREVGGLAGLAPMPGLVALPTPKPSELMVSGAVWTWKPPFSEGGNRGLGAQTADRAVALSGPWSDP
jgi:transposase